MLAACQKEETGTMTTINIMAEDFHGGDSKMGAYISASSVNFTWETGDEVRINDGVFTVTRGNNATISAPEGQPFTAPIRALSPASLYDGALTSDQVTVTLPDTYQWSTFTQNISGLNKTCQKLNAPMAFYGDASNLNYNNTQQKIVFKNLCGALAVKITNTTGLPLDMEEIKVSSNRYKLSGNLSINFTNLEGLQPVSTSTLNTVTMRFDNEDLTLQANESKVVLIPVLPVGDNNRFAIQVKYRNYGMTRTSGGNDDKDCFTYQRTQPSGNNALARSQFGYAPVDAIRGTNSSNPKVTRTMFFKEDGYCLIKDKWQLQTLGEVGDVSFGQSKIRIVRDIDMSGLTCKPMYTVTEIDGGGHTVSNATFETDEVGGYAGLLRNPTDAVIKDLTLKYPQIRTSALRGTQYAGFLIAKAEGTTTITNCTIFNPDVHNAAVGGTYGNDLAIGGLIGRSNGGLDIRGSTVINLQFTKASTSSPNYLQVNCGGMVGYATLASDYSFTSMYQSNNDVRIGTYGSQRLEAVNEVRFGGVFGFLSGGSEWMVDMHVFIDNSEYGDNFIVKSQTSNVYVGQIIGRAGNTASSLRLVPRFYSLLGFESRIKIFIPTGKTAYTGAEDYQAPSGTWYYGHLVGNDMNATTFYALASNQTQKLTVTVTTF